MKRAAVAAVAVASLAAVVAAVGWSRRPAASSATISSRTGCSFVVGDTHRFDVQEDVETTIDAVGLTRGPGGKDETYRIRTRGELAATVVAKEGADAVVVLSFAGATQSVEGPGAAFEVPIHTLSEPYLVRIGASCAVKGYGRPEGQDRATAHAQQSLAWALSFVVPKGSADEAFEERGPTGTYRAVYGVKRDREPFVRRVVSRIKESFLVPPRAGDATIPSGPGLKVVLGREGWFESSYADQTLSVSRAGREPLVRREVRTIRRVPGAGAPVVDPSKGYVWGDVFAAPVETATSDGTAVDVDPRVAALSATDVVSRAGRVMEAKPGVPGAWVSVLADWLSANPTRAQELVAAARRVTPAPRFLEATVVAALGRSAGPHAENALVGLLRETSGLERARVALTLAGRAELSRDAEDALTALARAGDPGALSSLGRLVEANPTGESAARARDELGRAYEAARDADRRRAVIAALATSKDPSFLARLVSAMSDADPSVRAAAADALGRLPGAAGAAPLAASLRAEENTDVIEAVGKALVELSLRDRAAPSADAVAAAGARFPRQNGRPAAVIAAVLGEAARYGNGDAARQLRTRLGAELAAASPDTTLVLALGLYVNAKDVP